MWKVIHQQHTFAIQQNNKIVAMTFPAVRRVQNFLGGGELACFQCIDSCLVSDPSDGFLVHYQLHCGTKRCLSWQLGTVDSQQFSTRFHTKWLLKWRQKTWSPSSQTLPKPGLSCKYSGRCHAKFPCPWLPARPHSSISRHQYFNSMATIIRGRTNWPSSMVIFQWCFSHV